MKPLFTPSGEVWHKQPHELPTDAVISHCTAVRGSLVRPRWREGKFIRDCWIIKRERSWEKTVSCYAVRGGRRAVQHRPSGDDQGYKSIKIERNPWMMRESARETRLRKHKAPVPLRIQTAHTAPTSRCRTVQTRGRDFGGRSKRAGCQLTCAINSAGDTGTPAVSASDTETAGGNGPDNEWIAQHWSWKSISP